MDGTHGSAVWGGAVLFEHGRVGEATDVGVSVARTGEDRVEGMFCEMHAEGSTSGLAVGLDVGGR